MLLLLRTNTCTLPITGSFHFLLCYNELRKHPVWQDLQQRYSKMGTGEQIEAEIERDLDDAETLLIVNKSIRISLSWIIQKHEYSPPDIVHISDCILDTHMQSWRVSKSFLTHAENEVYDSLTTLSITPIIKSKFSVLNTIRIDSRDPQLIKKLFKELQLRQKCHESASDPKVSYTVFSRVASKEEERERRWREAEEQRENEFRERRERGEDVDDEYVFGTTAPRRDYYEVLGVHKTATFSEIKTAFKRLALKLHPDKAKTDKETAEMLFKELNEAYRVLYNPTSRENYDRWYSFDGL